MNAGRICPMEKSVKAECIFYVNVIRRLKGVSLSERSTGLTLTRKEFQ